MTPEGNARNGRAKAGGTERVAVNRAGSQSVPEGASTYRVPSRGGLGSARRGAEVVWSRRKSLRIAALGAHWLFVCTACTGDSAPRPGVREDTVESPGSALRTVLVRSITSNDLVTLDRLGDITVDQDGSMVVVNGGTPSLLWIDAAGGVLREQGRHGQGPGEFESITNLRRVLDQLVVWDQRLRRLTLYSADGTFLRTVSVEVKGAWRFIGGGRNEFYLVKAPQGPDVTREFVSVDSIGMVTRQWTRSGHPRPVISYPSRHPFTGAMGSTVLHLPDCLPETFEVMGDGDLLEVDTGAGTTVSFGSGAEPGREVYRSPWRVPFDSGARERIQRSLAAAPLDTVRSALRRAGAPAGFIPAWREGLATPDGLLFLRRASCASREHRVWDVVSATGQHVGTFSLPLEAALKGASRRWLAVVTADSLGVEQIGLLQWDAVEAGGVFAAAPRHSPAR